MPHFDLIRIVQEVVLEGRKPAKSLAEEIGKPYSTLLREVNPFDGGAKLGIETLMDIMAATGNMRPLEHLAEKLGYELVPKQPADRSGKQMGAGQYSGNRPRLSQ